MTDEALTPQPEDIRTLFSVERFIEPQPEDVRHRVVERARASLPRNQRVRPYASPARRLKLGMAAAAAVVLFAFGAVAFQVGYRFKRTAPRTPTPALASSVAVERGESAPTLAVLPPRPDPDPVAFVRAAKPKAIGSVRVLSDSEAYARELPVLQPALDAVSREDFAAALVAIAAHQRKFPSGQLAEEREGLRIKALVGLGRMSEATRAGSAFRERFPKSAMLGQILEILGTRK